MSVPVLMIINSADISVRTKVVRYHVHEARNKFCEVTVTYIRRDSPDALLRWCIQKAKKGFVGSQ